jgi:hypothetical protein
MKARGAASSDPCIGTDFCLRYARHHGELDCQRSQFHHLSAFHFQISFSRTWRSSGLTGSISKKDCRPSQIEASDRTLLMMLIMIIFMISVLYKVKAFGAAPVKVSKEQVAEHRPLERSDHCVSSSRRIVVASLLNQDRAKLEGDSSGEGGPGKPARLNRQLQNFLASSAACLFPWSIMSSARPSHVCSTVNTVMLRTPIKWSQNSMYFITYSKLGGWSV